MVTKEEINDWIDGYLKVDMMLGKNVNTNISHLKKLIENLSTSHNKDFKVHKGLPKKVER